MRRTLLSRSVAATVPGVCLAEAGMPVDGGQANQDRPLPIARDQVTTQPPLMAKMVEALGLFF
jgi:protein-L-isoaspartate O-methyltransferase